MKRLVPLALLATLTGCPNPGLPDATITYHQTGACNGFQADDGSFYSAGDNAAYVMFGIESISNPSGSGATFNFMPTSVFTNTTAKDSVDTGLGIYSQFFFKGAAMPSETITQGNTIPFSVSGQMVLVVQTTAKDGASEANKTSYLLDYSRAASDPGVILIKSDLSQTSWANTPNCRDIALQ